MSRTPRAVVEDFFDRMADDDQRETVGELFATDATITLPGATFSGPDAANAMLEWLAPRYDWAAKSYGTWIEAGDYCISQGTLYGEDIDGERFEDVRYVDVYRVEDGLIERLDIYNDLAADGVVTPETAGTSAEGER
ncbi:nuclear transport factor 2 family protein [Natrialbaceae archaeon A-CW2]